MPSFSSKIQHDPITTEGGVRFKEMWNLTNSSNSRQNIEIPALLQGATISLVTLVKKIRMI